MNKYSDCQNFDFLKPPDSCHNCNKPVMQKLWNSAHSNSKKYKLDSQDITMINDICSKCRFFISKK